MAKGSDWYIVGRNVVDDEYVGFVADNGSEPLLGSYRSNLRFG
jgi:hypothetical protein